MKAILPAILLSALTVLPALPAAAQDAQSGERVFRQRCAACHATDPGRNQIGPSLAGVAGRAVAAAEGADYTPALRDLGGDWTDDRLSGFLENPRGFAPGTRMTVALRNPQQRADVIAYLNTLSAAD